MCTDVKEYKGTIIVNYQKKPIIRLFVQDLIVGLEYIIDD